ncbi:MAG TPA: ammonium transporter [Verrucomicrobiae bacterium]|jgi:Amt family ammonium transporter|nr:ammonium transporter [Verrucomicrobiae bacterium]
MKRILLTLALIATTSFGALIADAQTNTVAATNAPAAASAPAAPAPLPAASLDQRVAAMEAYFQNGDPTAPLKDTNGNIVVQDPIMSSLTCSTGAAAPYPGAGHNAWLLTSTALVLFMTLPGLALFYGGLVRKKNILSVCAQCFLITGLVTILWIVCGYGMIFGGTGNPAKEDLIKAIVGSPKICWMFQNVNSAPNPNYSYWVSENVFAMFQLMFAIITPALIVGSIAERMKISAILVFMTLWMFIVYFTQGHMVWGINGAMNGCWNANAAIKGLDFAGGTVVHMSSGWSGLVLCIILGKRIGFGKENFTPHSIVMTFIGASMLWVGWYGFNSGSAVAADVIAANAFTTTTIATAIGSFVWPMWEWIVRGKPSVLGFCSGAVAGLVLITPACGYVLPSGAIWIGIAAGTIPWFFCYKVKGWLGMDDALDAWSVHGIGGLCGAIMTGMFARQAANPNLATNLKAYVTDNIFQPQVWEQIKTVVLSLILFIVGTIICALITKFTVGLRPTEEVEIQGLDVNEHGEEGYAM